MTASTSPACSNVLVAMPYCSGGAFSSRMIGLPIRCAAVSRLAQRRDRRVAEARQAAIVQDQRVDRHHRHAATVADDGEALAAQRLGARERLDGGEQFVEAKDAQHAGASKGGIVDVVGTFASVSPKAASWPSGVVRT